MHERPPKNVFVDYLCFRFKLPLVIVLCVPCFHCTDLECLKPTINIKMLPIVLGARYPNTILLYERCRHALGVADVLDEQERSSYDDNLYT